MTAVPTCQATADADTAESPDSKLILQAVVGRAGGLANHLEILEFGAPLLQHGNQMVEACLQGGPHVIASAPKHASRPPAYAGLRITGSRGNGP